MLRTEHPILKQNTAPYQPLALSKLAPYISTSEDIYRHSLNNLSWQSDNKAEWLYKSKREYFHSGVTAKG